MQGPSYLGFRNDAFFKVAEMRVDSQALSLVSFKCPELRNGRGRICIDEDSETIHMQISQCATYLYIGTSVVVPEIYKMHQSPARQCAQKILDFG